MIQRMLNHLSSIGAKDNQAKTNETAILKIQKLKSLIQRKLHPKTQNTSLDIFATPYKMNFIAILI